MPFSLVAMTPQPDGRSSTWEFKATMNREYTSKLLLTSDTGKDDEVAVQLFLQTTQYALGAPHPSDPFALVQKTMVKQIGKDDAKWYVDVTYSNQVDPSWLKTDPTQRPVIIKLTFRKEKEARQQVWQDAIEVQPNGTNIILTTQVNALNSAGAPFDPSLERQKKVPVLTITQNIAAWNFDYDTFTDYEGAVNEDEYLGKPRGYWLVAGVDASEQLYENLIPYFTVTWTVEGNREGFTDEGDPTNGISGGWLATNVLDAGFWEYVAYIPSQITVLAIAGYLGGLSYTIGDVLKVVGGAGNFAQFKIDTVNAMTGAITGMHLANPGAYTAIPPTCQAVLTVTMTATAGAAYQVGDIVSPQGGAGTPAQFTVATVNAAGAITGLTLTTQGAYTTLPPVASVLATMTIGQTGLGYLVGDILNPQGGAGTPAQLTVLAVGPNGQITGLQSTVPGAYTVPPPAVRSVTGLSFTTTGLGYLVGDVLAAQGGAGTPAQFTVLAVGPNGVITGMALSTPGAYTALPPLASTSLSGGSGQGAAVTLTFGTPFTPLTGGTGTGAIATLTFTAAGVVLTGGHGTGAMATLTYSAAGAQLTGGTGTGAIATLTFSTAGAKTALTAAQQAQLPPGAQQIQGVPITYQQLLITDGHGKPVTQPWPLNGHGRKLLQGQDPVYLAFNEYGDNMQEFNRFLPTPGPLIASVEPNTGADAGGNLVTITGIAFTNATNVRFGGVAAPSWEILDDGTIQAVTPPWSALRADGSILKTVDVTVTTPSNTSPTTSGDQFTYE